CHRQDHAEGSAPRPRPQIQSMCADGDVAIQICERRGADRRHRARKSERDRRPLAHRYFGVRAGDQYIERTRAETDENMLVRMRPAGDDGWGVLWRKLTFRGGEGGLVNRAFDSAHECRAAAAAALREAPGRGNTVVGGSVQTANGEITPVCLPDTVDPRGPKGK